MAHRLFFDLAPCSARGVILKIDLGASVGIDSPEDHAYRSVARKPRPSGRG